jgi:chemotaxis response regulator CheB
MFESIADAFGEDAVAVVVSGNGIDGARGCQAILAAGGTVIAQEPELCDYPGMPAAAIAIGKVNQVLPIEQIGPALEQLFANRKRSTEVFSDTLADSITVLLADDHRIIRDGLRALLLGKDGFSVVAEAENGVSAVELAAEFHPQVVVMDVSMPDLDGIQATRQIRLHNPQAKVLALSSASTAQPATEMLRAGAAGYLTKHSAFEELAQAIRTVVSGKMYLSTDITEALVNQYLVGSE